MNKYFRNTSIFFLIIINFCFLTLKVEAFSLKVNPVTFLQKTSDIILNRFSDMIYYLIMQKKYIFDDFVDPNTQISLDIPVDFEQILSPASTTVNVPVPAQTKEVVSRKPIEVTTTTVPDVKKTTVAPVIPIQPRVVIPTEPILVLKSNPVSIPVEKPVENKVNTNYISDSDILKYTNEERESFSLKPLSANLVLDKIADLRADDLFANQYFDHVSPDGQSASELAKDVDYDYLLIGENLALGNFDGERGIVSAWMDSPGHRANILNDKYTELGVALKNGVFKGEKTVIAVQIFGLSMTVCPKPNKEIKILIEDSTVSIKKMQVEAKEMFDSLEAVKNDSKLDRTYYNQKIQEYNYFAKKVNEAVISLKSIIDSYNVEVGKYNLCLSLNK
jgi:uncharacterized protein YkwD